MNTITIICVALSLTLSPVFSFILRSHSAPLRSRTAASSLEMRALSMNDIANKWKILKYGAASSKPDLSLEVTDRAYYERSIAIDVSREGGLGLDLIEAYANEDGVSGLVMINDIFEGSNAANPLNVRIAGPIEVTGFQSGDIIGSIDGLTAKPGTITEQDLKNGEDALSVNVEGLNFDRLLDVLASFEEYSTIRLRVKRLFVRNVVNIEVVTADNEPVTNLKVLSGYRTNLRTVLQANNIDMYYQATARFDSPYQTGNCGGDGTCGTCIITLVKGEELTNERARVEDKALKKQYAPPNYRWACRMLVGQHEDMKGDMKIKLKPQSLLYK